MNGLLTAVLCVALWGCENPDTGWSTVADAGVDQPDADDIRLPPQTGGAWERSYEIMWMCMIGCDWQPDALSYDRITINQSAAALWHSKNIELPVPAMLEFAANGGCSIMHPGVRSTERIRLCIGNVNDYTLVGEAFSDTHDLTSWHFFGYVR